MAKANTEAADAGLTKEELEDFDAGWDEGEEVEEKLFEDEGGKKLPAKSDKTDDSDDEDDSDEEEADADADDAAEDDQDSADADESDDDAEEEDDTEDSDDDSSKDALTEEERKAHNDAMAKARIAEREARDRTRQAEKQAQDATIERYLAEAGDDEAEQERRQLNVDAWRVKEERISVNQDRLQAGIERAVASIDLFKTGSPAVQEELAKSLDDFEKLHVQMDDKGRPLAVNADVVQFLQAKAESIKRLQGDGAVKQEKSKSKEKSRTLTPPSRAPKKAKADPVVDGFDEEAKRY